MNIISIISNKRDKRVLSKEEIEYFVTEDPVPGTEA